MRRALVLACLLAAAPAAAFDWSSRDAVTRFRELVRSMPWGAPPLRGLPVPRRGEGPAPLHCDPRVIAGFQEAWRRVQYGWSRYEAGFRMDLLGGDLVVVHAPMTFERDMTRIPIRSDVTIAIAHTHPHETSPFPSTKDRQSPVPNYVISTWALYVTEPGSGGQRRLRGDWAKPCP